MADDHAPPQQLSLIHISPEQWEAMKAVDIRTVDKSQLVDLSTVHIDESLSLIHI